MNAVLLAQCVLHCGQTTDAYLISQGVRERDYLVIFDARFRADAVVGGPNTLYLKCQVVQGVSSLEIDVSNP